MKPKQRVLIFLHIPKTAGTTINDIFKKNYSEEEFFDIYHYGYALKKYRNLEAKEKEKLKIIKGHFPYGIHQVLEIPAYQYITILRDPVERVISQYHHSRGTPSDVYHEIFTKGNVNLENCMGEGRIPDNLQVRYLAGITDTYFGQCNEDHLEKAKENLTKHSLFGIAEIFDQSLLWFNRHLQLDSLLYKKKHVTYGRPKADDYPEHVTGQIKIHNTLDIELYNFARQKFLENIKNAGHIFQEELEEFKTQLQLNNDITQNYFKALKLLKENQAENALVLIRSLIKHKNLDNEIMGELFFLLAQHDTKMDDNTRSRYFRKSLEHFLKRKNYNRLNMYRIASLYKRLGEYEKAGEIFTEEINKKRNTDLVLIAGCYFHLGEMAFNKNRIKEAAHFFSLCIKANPNHQKAKEYLENKKISQPQKEAIPPV